MPGYQGHLTGGIIFAGAGLGAAVHFNWLQPEWQLLVLLASIVLLTALFPDVDTDSKGQNLFYGGLVLLDLILIYEQEYKWAAVLGLCAMLPALGHHRGWTHAWWAMFLVPVPLLIVPMFFYNQNWEAMLPYYLAAVLGYFSHLLLDRVF